VAAPRVAVVDTIGAGDAFGGGFLAWWHGRGLGAAELADTALVVKAAAFGAVVAARTCERAGASPPLLADLVGAGPTGRSGPERSAAAIPTDGS
jgi:fructokinase